MTTSAMTNDDLASFLSDLGQDDVFFLVRVGRSGCSLTRQDEVVCMIDFAESSGRCDFVLLAPDGSELQGILSPFGVSRPALGWLTGSVNVTAPQGYCLEVTTGGLTETLDRVRLWTPLGADYANLSPAWKDGAYTLKLPVDGTLKADEHNLVVQDAAGNLSFVHARLDAPGTRYALRVDRARISIRHALAMVLPLYGIDHLDQD